ncbi:hypothetical protein V6B16_00845 [Salinimicrobium catena]|uniref:hypothetical protein n=1 Tax=Salinimicrobium catena TaxID=390640 RepID=UPI002FE43510
MKFNSDLLWSFYLIAAAVLFFSFGNFIGSSQTEKELSRQLKRSEEKIQILNRENQQLSEQLTSRGIYSYPQAGIISSEEEDQVTLLLMLNGQKALKDLVVKRSMLPGYSLLKGSEAKETMLSQKITYLGSLKPHTPAAFEMPLKQKEAAIEFIFKSGKKQWKQILRVRQNDKGEIFSFWVITNGNDLVIDKHVDKGFPIEKDGGILLWEDRKVRYSEIEMNSVFRF